MAQAVKKIEISRQWRLVEYGVGTGEDVFYPNMQVAKQARKVYRIHKPSSACAQKFCSFIHYHYDNVLIEK